MENEIDDIEEMIRWIATVVQSAQQSEAKRLKQAMDAMLAGASQVGDILSSRCTALARQCRPRKAKPPKPSPVSGPQKQKNQRSSTDTPKSQRDTEKRPEGQSRIQQGIQRAMNAPQSQQQALRRQIYGAQNPDIAFAKNAKAIAR